MSRYVVNLSSTVDFAPETEAVEILQNVRTILSTQIGTVPLHRDFGALLFDYNHCCCADYAEKRKS